MSICPVLKVYEVLVLVLVSVRYLVSVHSQWGQLLIKSFLAATMSSKLASIGGPHGYMIYLRSSLQISILVEWLPYFHNIKRIPFLKLFMHYTGVAQSYDYFSIIPVVSARGTSLWIFDQVPVSFFRVSSIELFLDGMPFLLYDSREGYVWLDKCVCICGVFLKALFTRRRRRLLQL